jgi:hypothetical protein
MCPNSARTAQKASQNSIRQLLLVSAKHATSAPQQVAWFGCVMYACSACTTVVGVLLQHMLLADWGVSLTHRRYILMLNLERPCAQRMASMGYIVCSSSFVTR